MRENILSLSTLQLATFLVPLLAVPYLVRILEPSNYGRIAVAQALVHYFVLLTDYGFNLSATRQVPGLSGDTRALSSLFSAVLFIKAGLLLVGFALFLCLVAVVPLFERDWGLYLAAFLSVLGSALLPAWLFQGLERMRLMVRCIVAAQGASLVAIFAFIQEPADYRLAAAIQAGTPLLAGVMGLFAVSRAARVRIVWPGFEAIRGVLFDGWHVFLSTAAVSVYTGSTTLVLGWLTNPSAVGHFAAADKLVKAVHGLLSPVSQSVYPHVARLTATSRDLALLFIARVLRLQGLATLMLSVVLLLFAGPLVELVFGELFLPATPVLQWMAMLPFVVGLSNVFGIQTMLNFGMKHSFSRILVASGLINITLLLPLASIFGAEGAAISLLLTEVIVTAAMMVVLHRRGLMAKLWRQALS